MVYRKGSVERKRFYESMYKELNHKAIEQPDWTKLEDIPAGKETSWKYEFYLSKITRVLRNGVRWHIVHRCKNKNVLDIGALEHGFDNISKKEGMFYRIKSVAKSVTGLDIIEKDCERMRAEGYDFVCMDATSKGYLGKKFDVINVGDVIEHVDSPVALLDFCKRHLKENGEILVTTPNAYFLPTVLSVFFRENQICNFQHVSWIMPCMGLELGRRVGLEMSELVVSEPSTGWKRLLLSWLPINLKSGVFLFVYKRS